MTLKVRARAHDKGGGVCVQCASRRKQQAKRDAPSISIHDAHDDCVTAVTEIEQS
jgi:hypothetical protein